MSSSNCVSCWTWTSKCIFSRIWCENGRTENENSSTFSAKSKVKAKVELECAVWNSFCTMTSRKWTLSRLKAWRSDALFLRSLSIYKSSKIFFDWNHSTFDHLQIRFQNVFLQSINSSCCFDYCRSRCNIRCLAFGRMVSKFSFLFEIFFNKIFSFSFQGRFLRRLFRIRLSLLGLSILRSSVDFHRTTMKSNEFLGTNIGIFSTFEWFHYVQFYLFFFSIELMLKFIYFSFSIHWSK